MSTQKESNSIAALLHELRDETTTLLRQEVALAKAEMSQKASDLSGHAAKVAIGGFVAYAGLIVLLFGLGDLLAMALLNAGLGAEFVAWLGPSIVGLVVAMIGYLMFAHARKAMAGDKLVPERTLDTLRQNKAWAQQKFRHSHEQQPAV